jgi:hypothetical protein
MPEGVAPFFLLMINNGHAPKTWNNTAFYIINHH